MINLSDGYLMMIEPKKGAESPVTESPINDHITRKAKEVWPKCLHSTISYRGFHVCKCGAISDNRDWYTPSGRITNSLLVHYVQMHRSEVPQSEIDKLLSEGES